MTYPGGAPGIDPGSGMSLGINIPVTTGRTNKVSSVHTPSTFQKSRTFKRFISMCMIVFSLKNCLHFFNSEAG